MVLTIVELDGGGNGVGTIKVPMLNGARIALKLSGIQVAKGGRAAFRCVVGGKAEVGEGVSLLQLDDKLREKLQLASVANQLIANAGQTYAKEIADKITKIKEAIAARQKAKAAAKAALSNFDPASPGQFINALEAIKSANEAERLAACSTLDSLKKKKITLDPATLTSLQKSLTSATEETNKLDLANATCNNTEPKPIQNGCGGPCGWDFTQTVSCTATKKGALGAYGGYLGVSDVYDFVKEIAISFGNMIEAANDKNSLQKNYCGEFLMYLRIEPSLGGNGTVSYLAPPKGKILSSSLFQTETEYYQYVATRLIYGDKVGCKNLKIPETHYLDENFFKIRNKILTTLNWEPSWVFKIILTTNGYSTEKLNTARDLEAKELLDKIFSKDETTRNAAINKIKEKSIIARNTDYAAVYFEGEFGGYVLGKLGKFAIRSPFFKQIVGYLGSKISTNGKNAIEIYRGTDLTSELQIFKETEYIMSDAARQGYNDAMYSGKSIDDALKYALKVSQEAHVKNVKYFGTLENYMKAHTLKGTEIGGVAPRSMISFTENESMTTGFGINSFKVTVPSNSVIKQSLVDGSESEVFILHMIKVSKK